MCPAPIDAFHNLQSVSVFAFAAGTAGCKCKNRPIISDRTALGGEFSYLTEVFLDTLPIAHGLDAASLGV